MITARNRVRAGVLLCGALLLASRASAQTLPRVLIQTALGSMEVELDTIRAPITAGNFLRYADQGAYRGGRFHRTVRRDNQRGGRLKTQFIQGESARTHSNGLDPIPLERTKDTGLSHQHGTISMVRDAPNTATSGFIICIGRQPELDFGGTWKRDGQGLAAFGRVVRGMDVVRLIQTARAQEQRLTPPIQIMNITRVR